MIYDRWDVAIASFPFVDQPRSKARPVLVLSNRDFHSSHGMLVVAMITTAAGGRLPSDVEISDLSAAGLRRPSVVRWKIMTLADVLFAARLGRIAQGDEMSITSALTTVLPT